MAEKKEVNENNVKEVDNSLRNRKIRNWSVFVIVIAIVGVLIYFSCRPTSTSIMVSGANNSIQVDSNKKVTIVDTKNRVYVVENAYENSYSEIYYSTHDKTAYIFYVKSNKGVLNFRVTQDDKGSNNGIVYFGYYVYIRGTDVNIDNWYNSTTVNKSFLPTESTPIWYYIVQFLPTILFIVLLVVMWRSMKKSGMGGGEESIFSMGKSQGKLVVSNVKFSDVAGINEEKEELIEIVDYLKRPAKYAAMGARTPKGVILYGPPGTGKTLLAKAVAGEAKVPFFQVSGSAFEDMLVGVGAKRVRDLFTKARKAAPAIIFIDEIDSVASKRGKFDMSGGGGIADQTINQLLAEMDGFSTKAGVVVIAATNRLDSLDDAILRPGRFDRHIQVTLPDIKEREDILKIHAKNKNISSAVSFTDIARRTPGMSGAQLENVLNEATLLAVRFNKTTITMKEIDEAIDRVIAGPAKKSRVITEAERKHIATHEAGHALVGLYTPGADVVEKITIIPRGMAAGYTVSNPEKQETQIKTKRELLGMITTLLGGRAAEEIEYSKDDVSTGASNDLYRASQLSRAMVMQLGMTDVAMSQLIPSEGTQNPYAQKLYSEATALKADEAVEKIIGDEYKKAKAIVSKNVKELHLIVDTLLVLETIVKAQIDYIHKNKKLPPEAIAAQKEQKKSAISEKITPESKSKKPKKEEKVEDENSASDDEQKAD